MADALQPHQTMTHHSPSTAPHTPPLPVPDTAPHTVADGGSDTVPPINPLTDDEFAQLEAMLDGMRQRRAATPTWEFCEGFMAALVCCRRVIEPAEYWPVLLPLPNPWHNALQEQRFEDLWTRRWHAVRHALDTPVTSLDDAGAYQPALDHATDPAVHSAADSPVADAPTVPGSNPQARQAPSFGQRWAQGFMAVVQAWPDEWKGPRNTNAQAWRASAQGLVEALTQPDTALPTQAAFADSEGPPTVSRMRMKAFADAIWAVYNMRDMWRTLGPRVATAHKPATPGRNDPCSCGSGKKYKKCCGGGAAA